jgi:methylenetetrahydrofolate dehydrogenase (NADP+)/methenyltetrahydrofolate cyclohydrolase
LFRQAPVSPHSVILPGGLNYPEFSLMTPPLGLKELSLTARILDGKAIARELQAEIAAENAEHIAAGGATPGLAAVLVGEDPASQVYVRSKQKACERVGIRSWLHRLADTTNTDELLAFVRTLNADPNVHGILVQLPLPKQIDELRVLDAIDPAKDVDGFHPLNVGLLSQGRPRFLPCTPYGVLQILARCNIDIAGKHAVVLGRSDIVGKPMAALLAQKDSPLGPQVCNATVTLCHSRTQNLAEIARHADLLVAAVGRANFVTADMVKPGAVVVDVGINRVDGKIVGDVDFGPVSGVASAITPVPGGVGRLTVTMLLANTLESARRG